MKKVGKFLAAAVFVGFAGLIAFNVATVPVEQTPSLNLSLIQEQTVVVHAGGGHGSGVVVSPDTVITAGHVIDGAGDVEVEFKDGIKRMVKVAWRDLKADVAVLKLDVPYQYVKGADLRCEVPKVGEELVAVGAPMEGRWVLSWLRAASERQWPEGDDTHYVAVGALAPGMSGGPIFDRAGMVVGFTKHGYNIRIGWASQLSEFVGITRTKEVCRQLAPEVETIRGT